MTDADFKPHLRDDEQELLRGEMLRAKSYLEFGAGGSTVLAAECGIRRIVSVDCSSQEISRGPNADEEATRLAVHDFSDRPYCGRILEHAVIVASAGTMVVAEQNRAFSASLLLQDLFGFQFDAR